jgi:hypothetical protein
VHEKHLYEYAVIRVLPRVDREEFINVGVILYCAPKSFLRAECDIDDARLKAFAGDADLSELNEHLESLCRICKGGEEAGPIGKLSIGERFRWLTAPRSTIVQTSPVHTGLTADPDKTLKDLMSKLVN